MFRSKTTYRPWHGWLFVMIVVVGTILGIVQRVSRSDAPDEVVIEEVTELTEKLCEDAGGAWNDCGSACRGLRESEPCIEICVEYCECEAGDMCPSGYSCIDVIDDIGICW